MPEGYEKYIKPILLKKKGPNRFNPEYSSPRYEEEKRFSLIFPEKPDTGIKDIITASREKNFNEEKILDEARRKQVPIDPITSGIVKNAVAPIGEAFNTISKGAGNIGLGFNKAGATGDYSQLGEGGIELLQGLLHTAFTPFTVPYGGITGGLRGSGEVGSEIATGLDRTMQLPFDVINKGSELTQQGLNTLGYNPQNESGLETKADELLRELAGLVLLKKAHTGAKDIVNRESLPNIIKGEKQPPVKPNDVKQQINVDPKLTDFEFRTRPNLTEPVKGLTQEKLPSDILKQILSTEKGEITKKVRKETKQRLTNQEKIEGGESVKIGQEAIRQDVYDLMKQNYTEVDAQKIATRLTTEEAKYISSGGREGIEITEQRINNILKDKTTKSNDVKQTLNVDPKQVNPETGFTDFNFKPNQTKPVKGTTQERTPLQIATELLNENRKAPEKNIKKNTPVKTSIKTKEVSKTSTDQLKQQVEESGLVYNGIQKTGGKGDFVTWTDPKTQSTHLTPIKEFTTEKIIADRDRFRKDWEEASKQTKTQSTPSKDRIVEPTGEPKVEKQPYELNKSEFSQKVYSGKIDFEIPIAEKNIKFLVDNYHKTTDKQNKQLAKEEIDKFIDREHSSSVDVAISEGKIESHPDYPELTTGKSDKQPLEMTTDELNQEFNAYSDKLTKAEKYAEKSDTNIGNLSTPEQMLAPKDAVRFDEVRNELIKRETEIAKQKVTESRKNRLGEQNIKESAFNNLQWTDETPTRKRQLLKEAQSQAEQLRQQGINAKIERKKSGKGWNLTIDGKPQGKRELGLVERPEKGKLEDVKVSKEVEKPFRNEQEQKVTLKVAEAFTSAEDLPTGFGKKAHEKAIEDIRKDEGSELNPEAKIIRDRVNTILKEGAEIKNQRGESATSFIEPEQIKEFVNEKSLEELSIEGESFDLTAPETKVRKKKPEQLKMEGLGQAKMPDKAITGTGKGEETTPLFNQPKVVKGQEKLFIESEAQGDRLTELKAQLKDYEERKRLFAPDKGLGINNTSNYDRLIKETKDEIESERKKVDRYVTEYPELNEQPKEVKGQENLFEKKPFEMTSNEWNKAREELKPEIAQQNFTKGSESQAVSRTNKLIDLLYDVNKQAQQKLKDAQEGKIKLSEEETNNLLEQINSKVTHKQVVEKALREGKEVPKDVLSEYPELKQMKRVISDEVLQAARDNIKNKLNRLNTGIDPTLIKDYAVIGAYHLESVIISGAKKGKEFRDWAKEMMVDLGEDIRPHLRAIWNEVQKDKEFITRLYPKEKAVKEVIEQPKVVETKVEKTTGIKNAVVNKERVERGLEPLQTEGKRTWGKVWDEAKQKIESKEVNPRKLADDLTKEARPITDTEAAILDYDRVTLNNQHRKILDDIAKTPDDVNLKTELLKVEDALNTNDIAARLTGTEAGRSLAIRRMMLKDDYSITSLVQQARTANNGKTVSPEIRAKLEDLSKRIEDADKKFLEYEERISKLEAEKIIKKVQRDMKLAERKGKRQVKKQDIDAEFEDLVKQFAKTQSLNVAFTSEQIALLGKLTKNRVKAGVNSIEGVVDELYNIAKDKIENVSKRDIMDAISGYGKFTELTKDEINIKLRDIRRQGRLLSAIEDLQNKVEPLKTGFEREKLSKRATELTKTLNQLRKQEGELSIDPNVPLKSYKTRLENSIKEYERKLRENDFTKPERNKLELDAEAKRLVDLRDRLKNKAKDEIFKIEQGNRTTGEKVKDWVVEISNVPRTMMASVDLSAPLRQGVVPAFSHPITTFGKGGAFRKMFEYAKSEEGFKQLSKEIEDSPYNQLYRDSKLDVIDIEGKNISKREEAFISNLPEKIPIYGKLVRGSNRAYTGFLFKLRKDLFDKSVEQFEKAGLTFKTDPEVFKGMASWINNATGRGNFRSKLGQHALNTTAPIATSVFFSPRLIVSRMQLLNPAYYLKLPKEVRKLAMKDMAKFIGVGTSILGLAKLAGADIETDPRSSDFMKIKVGNTRQDIWGGLQQYVVLASKLATNESTSLSGQTRELSANSFPFTTRKDLIYRFGENKLSPVFGFMRDFLRGTNWEGEEFSLSEEALQLIVPLYINETIQSIQQEGLTGGLLSTPGLFGVGVSTYKNKKTDEMQSISNKQFEVSKLKDKALETRSKEDVKAYRKAQLELKQMRTKSKDYQNDLKDKRKKRLEQKNLLN